MKKLFISLLLVLCVTALFGCSLFGKTNNENNDATIPYISVIDENGLYSEANFAYNMALPKENGITLIENGSCAYTIVYPEGAVEKILWAVEDLQSAFKEMCGSNVSVCSDSQVKTEKEIVIGKTNRKSDFSFDLTKIGSYVILSEGQTIYIYGESNGAVTNGVYGFMEDYLGCMFLEEDSTYCPVLETAILEPIADVQIPAFEYRDVGDKSTWRNERFCNKLRVDLSESFDSDSCHQSLSRLDSEVLEGHPEYYAYIDGARRTGYYLTQPPQLCFSNPDVIDLLDEAIMREVNAYTGTRDKWWDISQQDSMNLCECDRCNELIEQMGSKIAPMLYCVIEIANRHPDVHFSTLSYHYGSTPPVDVEIPDNLMIKWCIMSSYGKNDYSAPLSDQVSDISIQQYGEITNWAELTENLFVWDYVTDFNNYLMPFPCYNAMQKNIQLLRDCKVKGVFTLMAYNNSGSDSYYKANLASHLLWNPDMDVNTFRSKFYTVYYGKEASKYMIDMQELMLEKLNGILWVYDFPIMHKMDYLSEENLNQYFEILQKAQDSTEEEVYSARLRFVKATLLFTKITLNYGSQEEITADKKEFADICEEFGITHLNELYTSTVEKLVQ